MLDDVVPDDIELDDVELEVVDALEVWVTGVMSMKVYQLTSEKAPPVMFVKTLVKSCEL